MHVMNFVLQFYTIPLTNIFPWTRRKALFFINCFFQFQYRVSNIHYNVSSGDRFPAADESAPVYITVGDGGNQEGLAGR